MHNIFYCQTTFNVIFMIYIIVDGSQSIELYDRLNRLIDYVTDHVDSQKPDLMLGIYMCEAQLMTMNATMSVNNQQDSELANVLENVKKLRENYEKSQTNEELMNIWTLSNGYSSIVIQHLLNTSFWVSALQSNDDSLFYGNLTLAHTASISIENFADCIDAGAPSPSESDECLAELLNPFYCTISVHCKEIMSPENESHGYHLTHKLLYFMVLKYQNCEQSLPIDTLLESHIYSLCSLILAERSIIIQLGTPNALKDLFLEQTLLCGLNGFAVFLDENTVHEILSWQVVSSGCYEYFDGSLDALNERDEKVPTLRKRSAMQLNGNCSDHMTGLAAAALGLFAKLTNGFCE